MNRQQMILKELRTIPGVGPSIARDFLDIGIRSVGALKNRNPERLYQRLCVRRKTKIDRCVLYVVRCAVYYASNAKHNPDLLKWWNWKDRISQPRNTQTKKIN